MPDRICDHTPRCSDGTPIDVSRFVVPAPQGRPVYKCTRCERYLYRGDDGQWCFLVLTPVTADQRALDGAFHA